MRRLVYVYFVGFVLLGGTPGDVARNCWPTNWAGPSRCWAGPVPR